MRHGRVLVAVSAALLGATPLVGQEPDTTKIARLEAQIEAITRELEQLRLGRDVVAQADTGRYGFGPAASKVYKVPQGVSIGGYGEVLYENFAAAREDAQPAGRTDQIDALRAIVYVGYKFSDRILFNSEIEIEHANEIGLEFGYVDYRLSDQFGLRAGLLLVPMGFLNELHEPPIFLGTKRPATEQQLLPSTWRENGLGVFGSTGPIAYRAYVVNGLDGAGFAASGLRGGRQKGSRALAQDLAVVGRVDYTPLLGLLVGGSAYLGPSGQGATTAAGERIEARTVIWEGHAEYKAYGLELRGLLARADVNDVAQLNDVSGFTGTASIGSALVGWYVQAGYDVLRLAGTATEHQVVPYVRYESLNTQQEVPAGFSADPATDRRIVSLGAAWKPVPNVVLKADYELHRNDAETGVNQFNVQLGYLF